MRTAYKLWVIEENQLFNKFGNEMDATRKSLESVVNHMEKIGTRSRALERKLRTVQELSSEDAAPLLED